jgi:hypothetical protein
MILCTRLDLGRHVSLIRIFLFWSRQFWGSNYFSFALDGGLLTASNVSGSTSLVNRVSNAIASLASSASEATRAVIQ